MATVVPVTTATQRARAQALREEVLGVEMGLPPSVVTDGFDGDPATLHVLAIEADGRCVGTGRLIPREHSDDDAAAVRLGPLVVARDSRRRGVAREMLKFLEVEALESYGSNGLVRVEVWAPDGSERGLSMVGFRLVGELDEQALPWRALAVKDVAAS